MTHLEMTAIRDAEADFNEVERSPAEWIAYTTAVRCGDNAGPAVSAAAEVGIDVVCRAWGVPARQWEQHSGAWCRLYNQTYCSAIEVMVEHAAESL